MRQRVTMGYFVLDTTGIRRPMREDVIVEADTGDAAAAAALAQHGARLASLAGLGPDGMSRIGIIGIEPAGNEPAPEPAMQGDDAHEPLPAMQVKRGPGRRPKVRVNAV